MRTAEPVASGSAATRTLLLLTAVYAVNYIDRQIVGILVEPIKHELKVTDTELGLLTGFAFALFYGGLTVPIARLAERFGGRRVIAVAVGLFSLATVLSALVQTYPQLLVARMAVGIGEAGTLPATLAIIAGLYPPERRSGAVATWTMGAQLGVLLGFMVAPAAAAAYGWRAGFLVAGAPGLLLAVLALLWTPETATPKGEPGVGVGVMARLLRNPDFWLTVFAGGAALFMLNAVVSWAPDYLGRGAHLGIRTVGLVVALGGGGLAALVTFGSGWLANRLHGKTGRGAMWMAAAAHTLSACLILCGLWAADVRSTLALMVAGLALLAVYQGPLLARLQLIARPQDRPSASALMVFISTLIGLGLGPLFVGVVSDHLGHGSAAGLRVALSLALAAAPVAGLLLIVISFRPARQQTD